MRAGVRRADFADVDAACAVLADAFADYPWTRWTVDGDDHVHWVEALQRLVMERVALPYGEVWIAVDGAAAVLSVAMWMRPGVPVPDSVLHETSAAQAALAGDRHDASVEAEAYVAAMRPTSPHYFLGAVGTRRDRQRRGLGTAVLTPVLDRSQAEGADVFLETSAIGNVDFYRRLGFVTVGVLTVSGGGPPVWAMMRTGGEPAA